MKTKEKNRDGGLRPFILVNMAMTADGKIATANRAVSSFGSPTDKEHLLRLRASVDAVMSGARTVDSNKVNLGPGSARFRQARIRHGLAEYNLRIIVSRSGSINPKAYIFTTKFSPIIILTTGRASLVRLRGLKKIADEVRICGTREIDWPETLAWLSRHWQVKRLLCEGGGELNDALFRHRLVDELNITICPYVFGGSTAPTIADGIGTDSLANAAQFKLTSLHKKGNEVFLVYRKR